MLKLEPIPNSSPTTQVVKCPSGSTELARVCTSVNCSSQKNRVMCAELSCQCRQTHKNCSNFLVWSYLKDIVDGLQERSQDDLFSKLLARIKAVVTEGVNMYNEVVKIKNGFMVLEEFRDVVEGRGGAVDTQLCDKINKKLTQFPQFSIPEIEKSTPYKNRIQQLLTQIQEHQKQIKRLSEKIKTKLKNHQQSIFKEIHEYNVQAKKMYLERKEKENQDNFEKGIVEN